MSTAIADERTAIEALFFNAWQEVVPIKYGNARFKVPTQAYWGRLSLKPGPAAPASVGNADEYHEESIGQVILCLFAPEGWGADGLRQLADRASDIFRQKTLSITRGWIQFETPSCDEVGEEETGLYQFNVAVSYARNSFSAGG